MARVILAVTNDISNDRRVLRIASTLSLAGHSVCIVGRVLGKTPLTTQPFKQHRMRLLFKKGMLFYAEYNLRLFLYLLFSSFDIATANDLDTLPAVFCAARLKRKKMVYDSHELFTEVPELQHRRRTKAIWQHIEQLFVPRLTVATTVCQSIAQYYRAKYSVDFQVVRNVPELVSVLPSSAHIPVNKQQQHYILYQGTFNVDRGLEQLIEAMQWIDNACLILVGYGPLDNKLRQLAEQLLPANKYWFVGRVSPDQLLQYTQLATIGCSLELDSGLNYRFALPNKMFDYIHAQIPVLVSNLPEMKQLVEEFGVGKVLHQTSPQAIAEAITALLANKEQLQTFRNNCAQARQHLSWQRESEIVMEIYQWPC